MRTAAAAQDGQRRALLALFLVLSLPALGGCGLARDDPSSQTTGKPTIELAHPRYESVAEIASASDVVVLGRLGDVVAHVVDDGGELQEGDPAGNPMVFNVFTVDKVVRGHVPAGDLTVGRIDLSVVSNDENTDIARSEPVMLFLKFRPSAQHAYMTTVPGPFYVITTASDNGVLDITGSTARARSLELQSVAAGGSRAAAGTKLSAPLSAVESAVVGAPGGGGR